MLVVHLILPASANGLRRERREHTSRTRAVKRPSQACSRAPTGAPRSATAAHSSGASAPFGQADLTAIGAMRWRTAHRIAPAGVDRAVEVGPVGAERIIAGDAQCAAGLPPTV